MLSGTLIPEKEHWGLVLVPVVLVLILGGTLRMGLGQRVQDLAVEVDFVSVSSLLEIQQYEHR